MGRDEGREEIGRKVRERIERSLARRDPEGALEGLLTIPAAARLPILPRVAASLEMSAPELQRQGAWGRLHVLAARAEAEPRLLLDSPGAPNAAAGAGTGPRDEGALHTAVASAPGGAAEAVAGGPHRTRWVLLLACLHAKDWARATRYLAGLRPVLDARAPALGRALAAWIERRGQLEVDSLGSLLAALPEPASPDPRLGYEAPSRRRASLPAPPATADEVEGQVLALAATQPFLTFSETVLAWQARASDVVAAALARAAAPIAVREILLALARNAAPIDSALLLGRLARSVPGDEVVAGELHLGTRLALPRLAGAPPGSPATSATVAAPDRKTSAALGELAAGAARHDAPQAFVVDWLTASEPDGVARAGWLRVAEGLLAAAGDTFAPGRRLQVWAAAMSAWIRDKHGDGERPRLPSWLQAATELVAGQNDALAAFVRSLAAGPRRALLASVLTGASLPAATSILGACWDGADEEGRREMSPMVVSLMDRAHEETDDSDLMAELGQRSMLGRLMRALDGDEGGMPPLVGPMRAVWRRVGERAVRYHPELLAWALSESKSPGEARRRIADYRAGRRDVDVLLEAIRAVAETERDDLADLVVDLEREVLRSFADDPASLARAFRWARTRGAPGRLLRDLARALLEAVARHPLPSPPPSWAGELEAAGRLIGKKVRRKLRRERPGSPEVAAPPKSRRKPRPPHQAGTAAETGRGGALPRPPAARAKRGGGPEPAAPPGTRGKGDPRAGGAGGSRPERANSDDRTRDPQMRPPSSRSSAPNSGPPGPSAGVGSSKLGGSARESEPRQLGLPLGDRQS
jgi:hypothetical protein